jgi:hypothetical protein
LDGSFQPDERSLKCPKDKEEVQGVRAEAAVEAEWDADRAAAEAWVRAVAALERVAFVSVPSAAKPFRIKGVFRACR